MTSLHLVKRTRESHHTPRGSNLSWKAAGSENVRFNCSVPVEDPEPTVGVLFNVFAQTDDPEAHQNSIFSVIDGRKIQILIDNHCFPIFRAGRAALSGVLFSVAGKTEGLGSATDPLAFPSDIKAISKGRNGSLRIGS